jgi:hypothetical protein
VRLLIALPVYGAVEPDTAHSLALTMADLAASGVVDALRLVRCEATILPQGRMDLAQEAINEGADRVLWVDADMRFKPANVRKLLAHDLDVVGVTYPKRRPPHEMTAQDLTGERITPGDGLIEANHIGFGLTLTKTSVFQALPKPWFAFPWIEDDDAFMGEDIFFARKARAHGFRVFIDREASQGIGHVGKQVFEV